jgi:hypothetical protein
LREGEIVTEFNYKNLVPLYAEEEMVICVRRNRTREERFDVWIEGMGGGYAVKGLAIVGKEFGLGIKSLKGTPSNEWSKGARDKETEQEAEASYGSVT